MAQRRIRQDKKPIKCQTNMHGVVLCPVDDEASSQEISYEERKTQRPGPDDRFMINDGIEYDGSSPLITDLFDESRISHKIHTSTGIENVRRSYIYIVSKKIDGRTFIKIGMSRMSSQVSTSTRLGFIQTVLIPGLKNVGFKVHYLFFFPRESKEKTSTFAERIEKDLHKMLQNHRNFRQTVIKFPSNNPSEWYLPDTGNYESFLHYVLKHISLQRPEPEEAYHFYIKNGKVKRDSKNEFMTKATNEEKIEHGKDYIEISEHISQKHLLTKEETNMKKGSKAYYTKKLLRQSKDIPALGDIKIVDVYYHKTRSDELRIFGNYYIHVSREDGRKPDIFIDFSEEKNGTIKYYTSIYNVLKRMKELNTLEPYGLESNYYHYEEEPIKNAKTFLEKIDIKTKMRFRSSELSWIIGRYVKDSDGKMFKAVDLKHDIRKRNKITGVIFVEVNTKLQQISERGIIADPLIAMSLAIDYHTDEISKYKIDDKYEEQREETSTKYNIYDFIQFKSRYFYNTETREPLKERFIGIIVEIYRKMDVETGKNILFYDILFETQLWRLEALSVDENSDKITSISNKKRFIQKVTKNRNLISKVIKELRMDVDIKKKTQKKMVPAQTVRRSERLRGVASKYRLREVGRGSVLRQTLKSKSPSPKSRRRRRTSKK